MEAAFDRMIPRDAGYKHYEGNSDSHIKASLVGELANRLDRERPPAPGPLAIHFFLRIRRPAQPRSARENRS
jgi:hypothetical protein